MPLQSILNVPPEKRQDQLSLVHSLEECLKEHGDNSFILRAEESDSAGIWEIIFLAKYRSYLFSDISGVIALNNINVLSAEISTYQDGSVVEIIMTVRILGDINPTETWKKVRQDLENSLTGKLALTYRLNLKVLPPVTAEYKNPTAVSNVVVDNESSDSFTLIRVFAQDKVGLLYELTHTLTDLRLMIRAARISTEKGQVADIFYVQNLEGKKVEGIEQVREVKRSILHLVSQI